MREAPGYYKAKIAKKSRNYRKSAARFFDHIDKTIGDMPVTRVTPAVICDQAELSKWWVEKHPSAIQLLTHLKRMFSMAIAERTITVNPAAYKDNLEHLLPDHDHKVKHRESLPYKDLPKFMADLRRYEDRSGRKTTVLDRGTRQHDKTAVRLTREGLYYTLDFGGIFDRTGCQLDRQ